MNGPYIAAVLVAGVLIAGCGSQGSASPPAASMAATATSAPTATSTPTPAPSPVGGAAPDFTVDCGPLAGDASTCLAVVGVAASGLGVDHPPVTGVAVRPLEPDATPAPSPSPKPAGSPTVDIETFTLAYWVGFSWTGGAMSVPVSQVSQVSQTDADWLPGLPLAATRIYRVPSATRSWTEPVPFAVKAGAYYIDGTCSGSGSTPGGATVVLQRLRDDGAVLADVHRVRCGPVELTSVFGDKVTLEAGLYRLAVEKNTGGLDVRLEPTATLN
jgi:hypothetical protein